MSVASIFTSFYKSFLLSESVLVRTVSSLCPSPPPRNNIAPIGDHTEIQKIVQF